MEKTNKPYKYCRQHESSFFPAMESIGCQACARLNDQETSIDQANKNISKIFNPNDKHKRIAKQ
jgi:hypothetical protein